MCENVKWTLIFLFLVGTNFVSGCGSSGGPATTATSSAKFSTLSEKVAFLEQYVNFRRSYEELEFMITYQNNSGGLVPGPSDWDMQIVARVPSVDLAEWSKGLARTSSAEIDWLRAFNGKIDHTGVSEWFKSGNVLVGVDKENAIVVYRDMSR